MDPSLLWLQGSNGTLSWWRKSLPGMKRERVDTNSTGTDGVFLGSVSIAAQEGRDSVDGLG
jgi:hypothetical protein